MLNMNTIGPRASEGKMFENINSCDLDMKVEGHPLTLTLIYSRFWLELLLNQNDTSAFNIARRTDIRFFP